MRVPASALLLLALVRTLPAPGQEPKPYLAPVSLQVQQIEPVVTAGESVGGYKAAGAPAGLWAEKGALGTVSLWVAHGLSADHGVGRSHGAKGAFVSRWMVKTHFDAQGLLPILREGKDAVRKVAEKSSKSPFGRITALTPCEGGLLFAEAEMGTSTADGQKGGRIWLLAGDRAQPLPSLGRCGREGLAFQKNGAGTLVLMTATGTGGADGRIFLFRAPAGAATAGLTGGTLFVLALEGMAPGAFPREKGRLHRVRFMEVQGGKDAEGLEREAVSKGAASFVHPAGAGADPSIPGGFWFTTLGGDARDTSGRLLDHNGRLYGLKLDDPPDPSKGGTLAVLLDGDEGVVSPSALAADDRGRLLIAEAPTFPPPGRDTSLWSYDPHSDPPLVRLAEVAQLAAGPRAANGTWALGGVADASGSLGPGWWFVTVATRTPSREVDLSEGGQVLALHLAEPSN